jgi:type I restriction enzyme S subunit
MERYDSYKDSGVDWLGEIPAHWEVARAKRIFREVSEKNHPRGITTRCSS